MEQKETIGSNLRTSNFASSLLVLIVCTVLAASMLGGCGRGSASPRQIDVTGMSVVEAGQKLSAEGWEVQYRDDTPYSDYLPGGIESGNLPVPECAVTTVEYQESQNAGNGYVTVPLCLIHFESGQQSMLEEHYDSMMKGWKLFYKDDKKALEEGEDPKVVGKYALERCREIHDYEADEIPSSRQEKHRKMLKKYLKLVKKCGVKIPDDLKDGLKDEASSKADESSKSEKSSKKNKSPKGSDTSKKKDSTKKNKTKKKSSAEKNAISWKKAGQHIGEVVTVKGPVVGVKFARSSKGRPTFLNIGAAYPDSNRVTAVIWEENRGKFSPSPEALYRGKTICVTGEVYVYGGACNIEVTSPSQIEVVE